MHLHHSHPPRKWEITLVAPHCSNDSDLVMDEMCHSPRFSPVSRERSPQKCVLLIEDEIEVYGLKAGVSSSLGVSVFSFKTELSYSSLTHLQQHSHNCFFFFSTPIPFHPSIFCLPPSDCIFPFVTDFGTIPLQITFPWGKRLLRSLQPGQPTPTLSFFSITITLCLST